MTSTDRRRRAVSDLLAQHWRAEGYTMPNRATYPWQWLWDSCFHAIVWAHLGDDRALTEVDRLFSFQTKRGFVPHMNYLPDPAAAVEVWGRPGASTITQPPMYGHAIAELVRVGMAPSGATIEQAALGLTFLLRHRRRSDGALIELVHPWESGCDDSARWDGALADGWNRDRWRTRKLELLRSVASDGDGGATANPHFAVGSIGFNALVAFNARELAKVVDSDELRRGADELSDAIEARWDHQLRTWVDDGPYAATSGRARTLDAHFALLVIADASQIATAMADLTDTRAFGAEFGPAGVHRDEPTCDHRAYWRGPAWPQMSYLLWLAAARLGADDTRNAITCSLRRGAEVSGWAEFWHPDTGEGLGAIPQSWSTLAVLVD